MREAAADRRAAWHPLVLVPVALTAWVYHAITRVYFFADDFLHLTEIVNEGPLVFLLRPFGGHAFLGRNLVFLATYRLFGADAAAFQWTVLALHLVNVGLLFGILRVVTGRATLACFGAALWGVSPLAAGTIGWYAAFGHVLAASALLLVLRGVSRLASSGAHIPARTAAWWYALLLFGATCYGPGIGIALVFPVVLVILLPAAWRQRGVRWAFLALPLCTLALYFGLRRVYDLVGEPPAWEILHHATVFRDVTPVAQLLGLFLVYSAAGTVLAFFMPGGFPSPAAWIACAALVAAASLAWGRGDRTARAWTLGMAVLWAGVYGMIAAGRANVFAMFGIPLASAAMTDRYHYAGTIPIVALLCLGLRQLARLPGLRAVPGGLALAAGLVLLMAGYRQHGPRLDEHRGGRDWVARAVQDVVAAVEAAPPGTVVYLENGVLPRGMLGPMISPDVVPGRAAVFLITNPSLRLEGREVRFIERRPHVLARFREGDLAKTPLGRMLIAPDEVPAGS